jgi:uncharacterized protein (TIGR02246 family)
MRFVPLVLLLAWSAPVAAQENDEDVAQAIAVSATAFSRALEAGDAATMAAQYTEDATLIPPSGRLVTGRDAIQQFWTPGNPDFKTLRHGLTTDRLEVSGDVAIEVGTWSQRGQLRDEEPTESSGRYLVVWRRETDGKWRMQFDSWTRPFEAPPAD